MVSLKAKDIRIETFKVNSRSRWNEDGVRLIYLPTDKVFESTAHRSQHANRAQCFKNLERYLENLNSKMYIVRGGFVRSKNDGQIHFVSARKVAKLYKVPSEACIFPKEHELDSEIQKGFTNKLTSLRPRNDGKYQLNEVKND